MDDVSFYLSVCEAARLLGISPESVRRRISRGQLPAVRDVVSRRYRVPRAAVLAMLEVVGGRAEPVAVPARPPDPETLAILRRFRLA